jgi:hypothetical protein
VLTYRRLLAVGTAAILGAGIAFATAVLAQAPGGPIPQAPGSPPAVVGQGGPTAPPGESIASNFRRDAAVTVMQRPREGYEALGFRLGTLNVLPKLAIVAEHSDNIFASSINEEADLIWRIQPEISINSDWGRHQLAAFARAIVNRYQDNKDENTTDWATGASGRLDVSRATQVNGQLNFSKSTEPRSSPNAQVLPPGAEPVQYDTTSFGALGRHEFNRLLATGRYDAQKFRYDSSRTASGDLIDQSYRDRTIQTIGGRLDYALSPATAVFVDVAANSHNAKSGSTAGGIDRDSKGQQAQVGVNFEAAALMRGDIGVGYMRQEFDSATQKDLEGFSTTATLVWLPTQLSTVTLNASRTIEDSAVADAVAYISTNLRVGIDHELLRNLILSGHVGYGKDDYTGVVREDRRTSAGFGASYLINRALSLSANYSYMEQETRKGVGSNFKESRVGVTLTVQH